MIYDQYVLLLKSESAEDKYHQEIFKTCNLDVVSIPVLDFAFKNIEQLATCLFEIKSYGGLIFTSQRAVNGFSMALNSVNSQANGRLICSFIEEKKIFVVGKATEKSLMEVSEKFNTKFKCDGAQEGCAENLANYMKGLSYVCKETRPFLFICGYRARDAIPRMLRESNIALKSICVYDTIQNFQLTENLSDLFAERSDPKVIVFFSPSGIEFSLEKIRNSVLAFDEIKIVAIGQTTANSLTEYGCQIDGISEKPTADHLSLKIKSIITK